MGRRGLSVRFPVPPSRLPLWRWGTRYDRSPTRCRRRCGEGVGGGALGDSERERAVRRIAADLFFFRFKRVPRALPRCHASFFFTQESSNRRHLPVAFLLSLSYI